MIVHNNKQYLLMRDGKPYDEAQSSISPAQLSEIREYMQTHEGETLIAENGEDWIFRFEPFPKKIIDYIKNSKHRAHLQYCYKAHHTNWVVYRDEENQPTRFGEWKCTDESDYFSGMHIPRPRKWEGNMGITVFNGTGPAIDATVTVKLTPEDLRRGEVVLPGIHPIHKSRHHLIYQSSIGKLAIIFAPERVHQLKYDEWCYSPYFTHAAVMESSTIIVGDAAKLNSKYNGGTKYKAYGLNIIRNDLASLGDATPDCCWMLMDGNQCTLNTYPECNIKNFHGEFMTSTVKFQIYRTAAYNITIKSESMGWNIEAEAPRTGTTFTTPVIVLTQDVPDLEIIYTRC